MGEKQVPSTDSLSSLNLKSISSSFPFYSEPSSLGGEVGRLAQLIDKLESKVWYMYIQYTVNHLLTPPQVKLDLVEEEEVPQGHENTVRPSYQLLLLSPLNFTFANAASILPCTRCL